MPESIDNGGGTFFMYHPKDDVASERNAPTVRRFGGDDGC